MDKAQIVFNKLAAMPIGAILSGLASATKALPTSFKALRAAAGAGAKPAMKMFGKQVAKGLALPAAGTAATAGVFGLGRMSKDENGTTIINN